MNYERIYHKIILNAKKQNRTKSKDSYYERHHIKPKSLGGDNSKDNLVLLTAREHFICHTLLWKWTKDNKMATALWLMSNLSKYDKLNSKTYSLLKEQQAKVVGERSKGKSPTKEAIAKGLKTRTANGNLKHTEESKAKMSRIQKGLNKKISIEQRKKISETLKGYNHTEEYKLKLSKTCKTLLRWNEKVIYKDIEYIAQDLKIKLNLNSIKELQDYLGIVKD